MIQNTDKTPINYTTCYNQPFVILNDIIDYSENYHQTEKAEFGVKNLVTTELIDLCKNKKNMNFTS